jgi:hypothetical protein
VRREGDDPLDLAILLDLSGSQRSLAQALPQAVEAAASSSLRPQDRLWIYAMDCNFVRSANAISPQPEKVRLAVQSILTTPALEQQGQSHCAHPAQLWAALAGVIHDLSGGSGRAVLLAVTAQPDLGKLEPAVRVLATDHAVTIFSLSNMGPLPFALRVQTSSLGPLAALCQNTGGVSLGASANTLDQGLTQFVSLLRGRYILDFPRPQRITSGFHSVQVRLRDDPSALLLVAGLSFALPDPAILADPSTIHSDQGDNIPIGNRRPSPN